MPKGQPFYTRDEFARLCQSMGFHTHDVFSIRINRKQIHVTYQDSRGLHTNTYEVR